MNFLGICEGSRDMAVASHDYICQRESLVNKIACEPVPS